MSLLQDGNASATTVSGKYGLAIAYGDGAKATAEGGTGDYALADGTNAETAAGGAAGSTGNNFNSAIDIGNNATGTFDDGAHAGSGGLAGLGDDGNHEFAIDFGNNCNGSFQGAESLGGNGDSASYLGNISVADGSNGHFAYAGFGDNDIAQVVGNNSYAFFGDGFDTFPGATGGNFLVEILPTLF
jgi:hypothetical protein